MTTSILILAAGQPVQRTQGNAFPLCLTELNGRSLLERIVDNTRGIGAARHVFAVLNQDVQRFHLDKVVRLLAPEAMVVQIPESTRGSACTALLAACQLDRESELLVISANELVDLDFSEVLADYRRRNLDGGLLVFPSIHPRYSYVRLNSEGLVVEAAQQDPISNHATAGAFWFARTGDFIDAAQNLIRKNASVNEQFYVAPCFNEIILKQGRVGVHELDSAKYYPLKDERQLTRFEQGVRS